MKQIKTKNVKKNIQTQPINLAIFKEKLKIFLLKPKFESQKKLAITHNYE